VKSPHWEESRMLLDMETYLSGDILTKVDRASMSCSLEVRCPLLDYRVVEAAIGAPLDFKFHAGIRKYMLKNILYKHFPATFFDRPKSGLSVPREKWLRTAPKDRLHDLTTDGHLGGQAVFDAGRIQELKRRFYAGQNNGKLEHVLWSLLMFQMWYDTYGRSAPA
jgi:asparagine synthase (glutamine-hydrolysing)